MKNVAQRGTVEFFDQKMKTPGVFSEQDAKDYLDKKKQFKGDEIFLRKKLIGLSGVIPVINENDVQKTCITNLSKGSVPIEKNIVVDKISLKFGFSPVDVAADRISYSNAIFAISDTEFDAGATATGDTVYARQIPIEIQNAEYVMSVDEVILEQGRVEDLLTHNVSVDAVNGNDKNFKQLEWPILLLAGKTVRLDLKFPEGSVTPAGFYYVEFIVKGLGLAKRVALS
jgi:hypothetical protein